MAELVSVVAMTHNPRIYWNADGAGEQDRADVEATFERVHRIVADSEPDVIIAIGNDHIDQFYLDLMPPFAVGIGDTIEGPFWYEDEIMHLPTYQGPNDRTFGDDILFGTTESGLGVARCERFKVDHAFTVPLSVTLPTASVPVVPVFTNTFGPPLPRNHAFFGLGQALAEVIRNRPSAERVAVVGSFNLSVDVGGPNMGRRHERFDEMVLSMIEDADIDHLVNDLTPERLTAYGNSTAEFLNYQTVLGIVGERKPDLTWYRLVEGWGGCPVVGWTL